MTPQAFRTMICPADHIALARSICATLAPSGGFAMFGVGLSATGAGPATHYVSTGHIDEAFANLMPLTEWTQNADGEWGFIVWSKGEPEVVVALCAEAGFQTTQAEVEALFAASDVTEQEPFTAFARLGLVMVQDPVA